MTFWCSCCNKTFDMLYPHKSHVSFGVKIYVCHDCFDKMIAKG